MNDSVIIPMRNYFGKIFNQSSAGQIIDMTDKLSIKLSELFTAFFVDPVYIAMPFTEKVNLMYHYRLIQEMFVDTRNDAIAALPASGISSIAVPDCLAEAYGGEVESYISAVKLCQNTFRALLRQNIGDDLSPNGYINTDAADLNEALLEFFTDLFRAYAPEAFVKDEHNQPQAERVLAISPILKSA